MELSNSILSARKLTIGYDTKIIGRDINIDANLNEITCIFGQNGVGKSTLLRTLSNVLQPLAGDVFFNKQSIKNQNQQELARLLGIVTTEKLSLANMTVRELVCLGRYPYTNWLGKLTNKDQDLVDKSIALCKIDYIANHQLSNLSDGQKQKAMIARALAQDTQIILLDEPTAHLDIINRAEIMILLSEIKMDKCIVVSSHDLNLSMQFADKLWLMNFNEQLISGVPEDLAIAGHIKKSFHQEDFEVDILTGNVIYSVNSNRTISINGEGVALEWTKHALERVGFNITNQSDLTVEVEIKNELLLWNFKNNGHLKSGKSLKELLDVILS